MCVCDVNDGWVAFGRSNVYGCDDGSFNIDDADAGVIGVFFCINDSDERSMQHMTVLSHSFFVLFCYEGCLLLLCCLVIIACIMLIVVLLIYILLVDIVLSISCWLISC